ncbi:DUF397 domain-containing protein [Streptomyces sp. NPDC057271]|uniref:DUF397 domain-containing protein n=1 Tax=unclassified Streptomyces TaxID=2593676 RepID=UPI00363C6F49
MATARRDLSGARWRKSSYSNGQGGDCVEVAVGLPRTVPVRDSKNTVGPVLFLPTPAWTVFVEHIKGSRA